MKQITIILFIIAVLFLSACSTPTTQDIVDTNKQNISSQTNQEQKQTTQQTQKRITTPGDSTACAELYTPDAVNHCMARETRTLLMCKDQSRERDRQQCMIDTGRYIFDKEDVQHCSAITENEEYQIFCNALMKEDATICFNIEEGYTSVSIMRDCVNHVAQKMNDENICNLFVQEEDSFIQTCYGVEGCDSKWGGEAALKHKQNCLDYVEEFN